MTRVAMLTEEAVVLHDEVNSLPVPDDLESGGDITSWKHDGFYAYSDVDIEITADKATELAVTDGALALYRVSDGRISLVALLNNGQSIVIQENGGPVVGFCQYVAAAGVADRLIVGGYGGDCTPSDGAVVTIRVTPIWTE